MKPGRLFIVATPIGNLGDMTYRAVETLKAVSLIACEDTRQTRKLLDHFGIRTPAISYHEHNERERVAGLLERLERGEDVAIVSDAGTPLIADPGYRIVHESAGKGVAVIPIPGACAAVAALSASGLPTAEFRFCGFVPRKQGERRALLESLADESCPLIFYEAPHRMLETLKDIESLMGDPEMVAAREVTKLHEEFLRGRASQVRTALESRRQVLGEFTLIVGARERIAGEGMGSAEAEVKKRVAAGMSRMDAIKEVARLLELPKREVYRRVEESEG